MLEDSCEVSYLSGQVLVQKGVFEVYFLCNKEVCPCLKDSKVPGCGWRLARRKAEVEEVEGEGGLDEELVVY